MREHTKKIDSTFVVAPTFGGAFAHIAGAVGFSGSFFLEFNY
jgi:hypothetical protein